MSRCLRHHSNWRPWRVCRGLVGWVGGCGGFDSPSCHGYSSWVTLWHHCCHSLQLNHFFLCDPPTFPFFFSMQPLLSVCLPFYSPSPEEVLQLPHPGNGFPFKPLLCQPALAAVLWKKSVIIAVCSSPPIFSPQFSFTHPSICVHLPICIFFPSLILTFIFCMDLLWAPLKGAQP